MTLTLTMPLTLVLPVGDCGSLAFLGLVLVSALQYGVLIEGKLATGWGSFLVWGV